MAPAPLGLLSIAFPRGLLDRERTRLYCGILLAIEISVFLFMAADTHGLIGPFAKPTSTDFRSFYSARSLTDGGTPEFAYDQAEHNAAEQRATASGVDYNFFYYPPPFLLLCAALAHSPYLPAYLVFEIASLLVYLIIARRIDVSRARFF